MVYSPRGDWKFANSYENLMTRDGGASPPRQGQVSPEKGRFSSPFFRSRCSTPYGNCSMSNLEVGLASLNLAGTNTSFTSNQRSISAKILPDRLFNSFQFSLVDDTNNRSDVGDGKGISANDVSKSKGVIDQQWLSEQSELRELYLKRGVQKMTGTNGLWNSNTQVAASSEKDPFSMDLLSNNFDRSSTGSNVSLVGHTRNQNLGVHNPRGGLYNNSVYATVSFADFSDTPIWSDPEPNFQFLSLNGHQGDDVPSSYSTCDKGLSSTSDAALSSSVSPSGLNQKGTSYGSPKSDGSNRNGTKTGYSDHARDNSTEEVTNGNLNGDRVDGSVVGSFSTFDGCSTIKNAIEGCMSTEYTNENLGYRGLSNGVFTSRDNSGSDVSLPIVSNEQTGLIPTSQGGFYPSRDLYSAYRRCGMEYFSATRVFKFIDDIKMTIDGGLNSSPQSTVSPSSCENLATQSVSTFDTTTQAKIFSFIKFLRSCNMNAMSRNNGRQDFNRVLRDNTTLQRLPLVLCCAKNGRLELLSPQIDGFMHMERGDMVIVDGDRGSDLVMVIEPQVEIHLGLLINFLRKKIHFDSLITNAEMHHPHDTFIEFLVRTKRGLEPSLNPRRYDVAELTELVIPSKRVLRFATSWEVSSNLHHKFQEELKSLRVAISKIESFNEMVSSNPFSRRESLTIRFLNAEYQFDRKKLTFYYVCGQRNDFRDLIKELFKFYKTRIWLCALPNNLGIEKTGCDSKEVGIYKQMVKSYGSETINYGNDGDALFVPPMDSIRLDNFHIGIYEELVKRLF